MDFRWNDWNLEHATKHGISHELAERTIRLARTPYPENIGDGKWLVCGPGDGGQYVQVIYVVDPDGTFYIIHARPMTDREKVRLRRRLKRK